MSKQMYKVRVMDYSLPSICSGDKYCYGTEQSIMGQNILNYCTATVLRRRCLPFLPFDPLFYPLQVENLFSEGFHFRRAVFLHILCNVAVYIQRERRRMVA